ncbi:B12-binding domain-containing protein [uncultured Gimesia sp.]|uniref:MerR family transcriptional regulator n=1 Tax=uncultured Gimesia sp. TaxID=1678688 RepID=UPI0026213288|nr:B12-binding domain-containing protein [uncultured Gimesia sp.]
MQQFFTPKQVSRAMQVSESSVKRWCDKDIIPTQYTAGGHRRIALSELIEFLRCSKHELVRPEILGLPATSGQSIRVIDRSAEQLAQALLQGDEEQCRRTILDLYLAEHSISTICDLVFVKAFSIIGNRWQCGDAEVYQERRGCELTMRVIHELHKLVPVPKEDAPVALGGAAEGDLYNMATTMIELVLRDNHWNAVSLGYNLPFHTLEAALRQKSPKLFWLSVNHIPNESEFIQSYNQLFNQFGNTIAFVVGGRALHEDIRKQIQYATYCDNIRHVESFAQTLLSAAKT